MKNFVVKNIPESSSEWELKNQKRTNYQKSVENTDKLKKVICVISVNKMYDILHLI